VRFSATAAGPAFDACHCATCRRWSAGPFLSVHCDGTVHVGDRSQVGVFRSSEWAERHFCRTCGTSLFYKLIDRDYWSVSLEALDDPSVFAFESEIFIDEKPDRYAFANDTRKVTGAEAFAEFTSDPEAGNG
jgi:hypothetical protein